MSQIINKYEDKRSKASVEVLEIVTHKLNHEVTGNCCVLFHESRSIPVKRILRGCVSWRVTRPKVLKDERERVLHSNLR
jgi:hypothetical protein